MTRDNDDHSDKDNDLSPPYDANPISDNGRREPNFGAYDEDEVDEYEEPERDIDYSSGFHADSAEEEEEIEDSFPEEDESDLVGAADQNIPYEPSPIYSESDSTESGEPDDWLEDGDYPEDDNSGASSWPLSLIGVAAVALVLLTAGIYGVMQERAATQAELRELRAALATSPNSQDVSSSRETLRELQRSYDTLAANAEALTLENRRLTDTIAGLEAQLGVQQATLAKAHPVTTKVKPPVTGGGADPESPSAAPAPVAPTPAAAAPAPAKPATAQSATSTAVGPWFVNFASYTSRAMAETWANKLQPTAGKVLVVPSTVDGKTLYRVRVTGLSSRESAQDVARNLETTLQVSRLWVGQE